MKSDAFLLSLILTLSLVISDVDCADVHVENWNKISKLMKTQAVKHLENSNEFNKIAAVSPRNYSIVILFSTKNPKCASCQRISGEFTTVAQAFNSWRNQEGISFERSSQAVFFFELTIENSWDLIQKFELRELPALIYFPPAKKGLPKRAVLSMNQWSHTKSFGIRDFISDQSTAPVYLPMWDAFFFAVKVVAYFSGMLATIVFLKKIKKIVWSPWFYFFLILCLIASVFFGTVNILINNPPWFYYNSASDQIIFIHPNSMVLFRAEGLIVSSLVLLTSFSVIGIADYVPRIKNRWIQRLMFLVFVSLALLFSDTFMQVYCEKNKGYPFQYFYPVVPLF